MVVVLPAPLGPSKPYTSPSKTLKVTPRTASTFPRLDSNVFLRSLTAINALLRRNWMIR